MSNLVETANSEQAMDTSEPSSQKLLKETVLFAQHDWNYVNPDETFFVGYRKPNEKTKFVDVKLNKTNEFQDELFTCRKLPYRALSVEMRETNVKKTFVGPVAEYDQLHKTAVSSIDISKTGNLVVSADSSNGLLIWNAQNADILRELEGHALDVNCCRFFPSGMVVLSGGIDMSVRIWSAETGECPRVLQGHKAAITDLAFIAKGEDVLSASKDGTICKWNCGSGKVLSTMTLPSGFPVSIKLNHDQSLLFAGSDQGYLHTFDANSHNSISSLYLQSKCTSLAIHENYAFAGSENGTISIVDLRKNAILQNLKIDRGRIQKLSTGFNGLLVSFADGGVCLYDDPSNSAQSKYEFTGADCDATYDFTHTSDKLFTACRDKVVRKYALEGLLN